MSLLVRFTNKSVNVPYSPTTTISAVITSALKKGNIEAKPTDNFVLRYNNKDLDNSQTLKRAGIVQGSTVSLHKVRKSKTQQPTKIAIQLHTGKRVFANLPITSTLWDVLVAFESEIGKNICSSPDSNYSYPQLTFMNRSFSSISDLQSNTISSLGAQNGLFRLSFGNETGKTVRELGLMKAEPVEDAAAQQTKEETPKTKNENIVETKTPENENDNDPMETENEDINSKKSSSDSSDDNDKQIDTEDPMIDDSSDVPLTESSETSVASQSNIAFDRNLKYFPIKVSAGKKTSARMFYYSLLVIIFIIFT